MLPEEKVKLVKRVHYLSEKATRKDLECLDLGRAGFYMKAIAKQTGLSIGQVAYRLKMAGIRPGDFRRMESDLARQIVNMIHDESARYFDTMVSAVRKYLKE